MLINKEKLDRPYNRKVRQETGYLKDYITTSVGASLTNLHRNIGGTSETYSRVSTADHTALPSCCKLEAHSHQHSIIFLISGSEF